MKRIYLSLIFPIPFFLYLLLAFLVPFSFPFHPTLAQTTTTTLKEPEQIQEFLKVTKQIRCICLPSLPIQGCSYNMCIVSSYLKTFIENRIREGMKAEEILEKFEKGFGESLFQEPVDEVVLHFQRDGNERILAGLRYGFGKSIYATPDSTWINLSLAAIGLLGLLGIGYYVWKMVKKPQSLVAQPQNLPEKNWDDLEKKYLTEIDDENG